jgi:hypothetical protein
MVSPTCAFVFCVAATGAAQRNSRMRKKHTTAERDYEREVGKAFRGEER